ncbi:MAG: glycine zipper 2TM domain-containing protein [Nitrosomonas sp.]|nr:glycine zipper 2TM domain-containing protein [Nitrosomonas sp.]MDO8893715.1 glycine zipper 2TM domain-containing protein [Nitrosomonas sp.]MDO9469651.1 glycine zipper 2TM domain-containing protein [Nitrosomonas sp.]MDP1786193.1 glycine zipper 2TM domain-containing protein [Nitrosomonas sp.]MDP2224505.1 glycine zipper 2TM domain-containing protein [Nitrosomonas sp.]MDP3280748.1 glycine zipper 2TM domain-containing protein [Nitrosomonas sp.]
MKTMRKIIVSAAVITVIVVISGCSGMSTRDRNTALGAGVGAVGGAVLTGGSTLGTVGGAAVGGVIGNQIGNSTHKK